MIALLYGSIYEILVEYVTRRWRLAAAAVVDRWQWRSDDDEDDRGYRCRRHHRHRHMPQLFSMIWWEQ